MSLQIMPEPERRRRRPAVSCTLCRRRKIKCNRESPCSNCIRSRNQHCIYAGHPPLSGSPTSTPPVKRLEPETTPDSSIEPCDSWVALTTSSISSSQDVEVAALKKNITQLEEQLSKLTPKSTNSPASSAVSDIERASSTITGTVHFRHEKRMFGHSRCFTSTVMHKTRLFGQSHAFNALVLIRDIIELIDPYVRHEESRTVQALRKCKQLGKIIKSQLIPPWPTIPTPDLPPKHVADELISNYLCTTESMHRVLHVPTFKAQYEAVWTNEANLDTSFLILLKLVLAIGATSFDQTFSLRASATKWVYEAQTWLSGPEFKSRLHLQFIQTHLLLLLARELCGVHESLTWVSSGSLLRIAFYMGLHRDPRHLPRGSIYSAEMRRRLWNTLLEMVLQSSMDSGITPLLSMQDFDTEPPGNFNDDCLLAERPKPKAEKEFTQTSVAIALRKTFPIRLAVAKQLNDLTSHNLYEETLRLDTELRSAYKTLVRDLRAYNVDSMCTPGALEIQMVDFLMRRYQLALHIPFFEMSLKEADYAFSRQVILETSLKIWYAVYPPNTPIIGTLPQNDLPEKNGMLPRLAQCGAGFSRTVVAQSYSLIALDLRAQVQAEDSVGSAPIRPDLLSVLHDAKSWTLRCFEIGELNAKTHLSISLLVAQIEGFMQGLSIDQLRLKVVRAAEEASEAVVPLLERRAGTAAADQSLGSVLDSSSDTGNPLLKTFDFAVLNNDYDLGNDDLMSWDINDGIMDEFFG